MLRIAICDDQAHILHELSRQFHVAFECKGVQVQLLSLSSADALFSAMADAPLDALFLDIGLGGIDGIAIGRRLRSGGTLRRSSMFPAILSAYLRALHPLPCASFKRIASLRK